MRRRCIWLFSVKHQVLVLLAALALALVPLFGGGLIAGAGGTTVHGAQCVYDPATGGCAGPETGGGGCTNNICPNGSSANTPQNTDPSTQTINMGSVPVQIGTVSGSSNSNNSTSSSAALGGVCIMPATISAPVPAPGVGYPATGAYTISTAVPGKLTVCQASGELEFSGPSGALIVVSQGAISQSVTLDASGAGTVATAAFGR